MPVFMPGLEEDYSNGLIQVRHPAGGPAFLALGPDLDGDGLPDILAGVPLADGNGQDDRGHLYAFGYRDFGVGPAIINLDAFDAPQDPNAPENQAFFGSAFFGAFAGYQGGVQVAVGDVNGDGRADFVSSAPSAGLVNSSFPNGDGRGITNIWFNTGSAPPPAGIGFATLNDGINGVEMRGAFVNQNSGVAVAAGDVNGDGKADIIIGANSTNSGSGRIYVINGSDTLPGVINLGNLGNAGFVVDGFGVGANGGANIITGDFNDDGIDDILTSAQFADPSGRTNAGAVHLINGSPNGFSGTFNVGDLNGPNGTTFIGPEAGAQAGWSISSLGDFNGDGIEDFAMSAPPLGNFAGAVFVVLGTATPRGAVFDLASLSGPDGFKVLGTAPGNSTGFSITGGIDMNRDGYDDMIIGAPHVDGVPGPDVGRIYVVYGGPGGFAPVMNLADLTPSTGFWIEGDTAFQELGRDFLPLDDPTRALADSLAAGGWTQDSWAIIQSQAPTQAVNRVGSDADQTIEGSPENDTLDGGRGDDLLIGGKGADMMNGGDGDDAGVIDNDGDFFNGGGGTNTAILVGDGSSSTVSLTPQTRDTSVWALGTAISPRFNPQSGITVDAYNLFIQDAIFNSGAGSILTIQAEGLPSSQSLNIDASGVSNGQLRVFAPVHVFETRGTTLNDGFLFDTFFHGMNNIDGNEGADSVAFRGPFSGNNAIVLGENSVTDIDVFVFLSGNDTQHGGLLVPGGLHYELTTADGNVAAGEQLDVIARLGSHETLRFIGSGETNGFFRILAGDGNDILTGGALGDTFFGGRGADILNGGGGSNIFLFRSVEDSTPQSTDQITFGADDLIDVSFIDAILGTEVNDAFIFIGSDPFTNVAGQLRAVETGPGWEIQADINGDSLADFLAVLLPAVPDQRDLDLLINFRL